MDAGGQRRSYLISATGKVPGIVWSSVASPSESSAGTVGGNPPFSRGQTIVEPCLVKLSTLTSLAISSGTSVAYPYSCPWPLWRGILKDGAASHARTTQ